MRETIQYATCVPCVACSKERERGDRRSPSHKLKRTDRQISRYAGDAPTREESARTTNQQVVYIEASMLVAINPLMLKMIQSFIPKQVHEKLALRYKDAKSEMVFWVQYIGYVFEQGHSNAAALRDRDMAGLKLKMLAPMQPGTSVPTFKAEYEISVINYVLQRSPSRWIGGAALIPGRTWRRQWGRCAKTTLRKI